MSGEARDGAAVPAGNDGDGAVWEPEDNDAFSFEDSERYFLSV